MLVGYAAQACISSGMPIYGRCGRETMKLVDLEVPASPPSAPQGEA